MSFMDILKWVGIGFAALLVLGFFVERSEKKQKAKEDEERLREEAERAQREAEEEAERERKEAEEEAERERLAKLCPECGKEDAVFRKEIKIGQCKPRSRRTVEAGFGIYEDVEGAEHFDITIHRIYACKYCSYTRVDEEDRWNYCPIDYDEDDPYDCPKCYVGNMYLKDSKEIDRYDANKKVTETSASGKQATKYIKFKKVVIEHTFACNGDNCDFETTAKQTKELN